MAKEKTAPKPAARKVKDKWRAKEWYKVYAPDMFSKMQIGETLAEEPQKLFGRVVEVTVQDLTGDFSRMHIKLSFQINDVKNYEAFTQFVGHDLTSDYIRRLTRRKRSKIDCSFNVVTRDSFQLSVKPIAVADKRIQSSQQKMMRNIMGKLLQETAASKTLGEFVKEMISGELTKSIANAIKVVYPLKKVEIRKSEVKVMGTPLPSEEEVKEEARPEAEVQAPVAEPEMSPPPPPPEDKVEEEAPQAAPQQPE